MLQFATRKTNLIIRTNINIYNRSVWEALPCRFHGYKFTVKVILVFNNLSFFCLPLLMLNFLILHSTKGFNYYFARFVN